MKKILILMILVIIFVFPGCTSVDPQDRSNVTNEDI